MRILEGRWAGRHLTSPAGRVRPTSEEVRRGWMAALARDLEGARVLELFAGSGAMGLEALSRGAKSCDFVESSPSALHALKANIAALRLRDRTRIFKRDALVFLERIEPGRYDIVLADPPYGSRQADRLVEQWLASPFSPLLCVEHQRRHLLPGDAEILPFGDSAVSLFRAPAPAAGG